MLHNTLVPPKPISNPSRHFTTGMRTPTQKTKKKGKKKKNTISKVTERRRQGSTVAHTNATGIYPQTVYCQNTHTHATNPHSTIHAKLGSTTPHPQQGKRTAAFGGEILLSTVTKHDKLPTLGKFDT